MNYVKDMQAFDSSFTAIKKIEADTEIDEILSKLKRNHDKKNEVYSKMYELSKNIDNLQLKIDEAKEYNWQIMEVNKKLIVKNDQKEQQEIDNKNTRNDVKKR